MATAETNAIVYAACTRFAICADRWDWDNENSSALAASADGRRRAAARQQPKLPEGSCRALYAAPGRDRCVHGDVLRQTLLNRISIVTALAWPMIAFSGGQAAASQSTVMRCEEATRARPQTSVAYTGQVDNDDYKLSLRVPDGLKGWGGVAPNAPFHGFTIFLDSEPDACVLFEVHLRVDPTDAPEHPASRSLHDRAVALVPTPVDGEDGDGLRVRL